MSKGCHSTPNLNSPARENNMTIMIQPLYPLTRSFTSLCLVWWLLPNHCNYLELEVEARGLIEDERVAAYHERNYTWPPKQEEFIPSDPNWRKIMTRRLEQVARIENSEDMYNGKNLYNKICSWYTSYAQCIHRVHPFANFGRLGISYSYKFNSTKFH